MSTVACLTAYLYQGPGGNGAYPSYHMARGTPWTGRQSDAGVTQN